MQYLKLFLIALGLTFVLACATSDKPISTATADQTKTSINSPAERLLDSLRANPAVIVRGDGPTAFFQPGKTPRNRLRGRPVFVVDGVIAPIPFAQIYGIVNARGLAEVRVLYEVGDLVVYGVPPGSFVIEIWPGGGRSR